MASKNILRVAIIGTGFGAVHARAYNKHPRVELVAVAGRDAKKTKAFAKEHGIAAAYSDWREMLATERLDAISIVTPNALHEEMSIAALQAGCHVLCEKPLAPTAKAAKRIIRAAKSARKQLAVNFPFRFDPCLCEVKRLIDSGALGRIYYLKSRWLRPRGLPTGWFSEAAQSGGGALLDIGVHRLDVLMWLLGRPKVESVNAVTHNALGKRLAGKRFDVEDMAALFIRLKGGAAAQFEAAWACNAMTHDRMEREIFGEKGGIVHFNYSEEGYELHVFDGSGANVREVPPRIQRAPFDPTLSVRAFADALLAGTPAPSSPADALAGIEIIEAAYKSARTGKEVRM